MNALGLLTGGSTAPPAVRRGTLEVSFGGASVDEWAAALIDVTVEAGLAPFANSAEVRLAAEARAPSVALADAGSISLGFEDSGNQLVFTGEVDALGRAAGGALRVIALDSGGKLARLRVNQSYDRQKAGDIVRDLIGREGLSAAAIEDGLDLPFYVVDDRRGALRHIAELARKSGLVAWVNGDGEIAFQSFSASQVVRTFQYGEDILRLEARESAAVFGEATTIGEGAAGSQGTDAWPWLLKDASAVKATSGSGAPRQFADASLRSAAAARTAAGAIADAAQSGAACGTLLAPGAPDVTPGCAIEIAGAAVASLNGVCMVHRVRHRFSKRGGFTTRIVYTKAGAGGAAGGSLLESLL